MALQQLQITKSGPPIKKRNFASRRQSKEVLDLLLREIKKLPLGTLTIISDTIHFRNYRRLIYAECSACGIIREMYTDHIRLGKSKNCRCHLTYGDRRSRILQSRFCDIRKRCTDTENQAWKNYGGRGIRNKFKSAHAFVTYVLQKLPHPTYKGVQIDRIHNDGHYEPGNIKLSTPAQQARNTRKNRYFQYKGQRLILADLATQLKLDYPVIRLTRATVCTYLCRGEDWRVILAQEKAKSMIL